ncbi:MAG: cupin domain-containing protein [Methanotrichaceae archaeon]|nr:cupin domain-containing protein [Methanotrichaceae archaeon]
MSEKLEEIGSRLRELRELNRLSVNDMAEYLKVPAKTYICYEEGKRDIPASKLIEIARKFDVDMGLLLTGHEPKMNVFTVTRKGMGAEAERRKHNKQYKYQSLAEKFVHKKAEPFIVTIEPLDGKSNTYSHHGQEFDLVLEGKIRFRIHDQDVVLDEGDSIFFDSSYSHALEAMDDKPAKLLVLVM